MSTAAYALGVDRRIDWLSELNAILEDWDHVPEAARGAVGKVVRSLLADPTVPAADVARAAALLASHRRRPCDLV
ncbi:MAG: hypothetical protein ACRDL2_13110 [Gaiellaceae bacterium]